jgi:hypothetical protein
MRSYFSTTVDSRTWSTLPLALAIAVSVTASTSYGQTPPTSPDDAIASYQRFLQSDRASVKPRISVLTSSKMAEFMKAVQAKPSLADTKNRLLAIQEISVPVSDPGSQPTYEQLLAEVVGGDETAAVYAQVFYWNKVAMDATAIDHTPPAPNTGPTNVDQVGPARTSRAMAIVHIAMFEALNAISKTYPSYHNIQAGILQQFGNNAVTTTNTSARHAVAYAAARALSALYPSQAVELNNRLAQNISHIPSSSNPGIGASTPEQVGESVGNAAADAILNDRAADRARTTKDEPLASVFEFPGIGNWHKDPLNADPTVALGGFWYLVRPFVMQSSSQFHLVLKGPPKFDSPEFAAAFNDVLHKGVDKNAGPNNPPGNTDRLAPPAGFCTRTGNGTGNQPGDEEFIGKFWAYDATPSLCAPPRLYNMIATSLANSEKNNQFPNGIELARYLAILNVAMADAGIAAWEAKYTFLFPRPVTYIRAALPGATPIAAAMPKWAPLGAPVTNGKPDRVNFTPPFPSYPSGHAVFGGAVFEVFRKTFNSDDKFTFLSDEYNGLNHDPNGMGNRPKHPVTFPSFTAAETENGRSRIYLGIHWQFDAEDGIKQGNAVADYVLDNLYKKPVVPKP